MTFEDFKEKHSEELREAQIFLSAPLSDDAVVLRSQLCKAVPLMSRINVLHGWAVSYFKKARAQRIEPKDYGPVLDREVKLESDTADERRYREMLEGLADSLKIYISVSQTLVKAHIQEMVSLNAGRG